MQRIVLLLLAAASLLAAAPRPRYGGTLRMELRTQRALEPSQWPMAFETLVTLDDAGRVQPALAVSWRHDAASRKWYFHLRPNVKLHDGAALTVQAVAGQWDGEGTFAIVTGDELMVQWGAPASLADFADRAHAVAVRTPDGALLGTGPFRVVEWDARRAVLAAFDDYWAGRPFLDGIEVQMGRTAQQRLVDLELGRAELIELGPGDVRRAAQTGARIESSAPIELIALVFDRAQPAAEAVALSIDRSAIVNVLLQKHGEAAGGLLPQWLSGYAMLFRTDRDLARARALAPAAPPVSLAYEAGDPLARNVAERIVVNAREAGLKLSAPAVGTPDARLVRSRITVPLRLPGLVDLPANAPPEALYAAERALVDEHRVIPLVHLPVIYAASQRLNSWTATALTRMGDWRFDDLWLEAEPQ